MQKNKLIILGISILLILFISSCKKDKPKLDKSTYISFNIYGKKIAITDKDNAMTFQFSLQENYKSFEIWSTDGDDLIWITVPNFSGTGKYYMVDGDTDWNFNYKSDSNPSLNCVSNYIIKYPNLGNGSVNITKLTENYIEGYFEASIISEETGEYVTLSGGEFYGYLHKF